MNKKIVMVALLFIMLLVRIPGFAADLTEAERDSLKAKKVTEHFWYDSYLGDNQGLFGSLSWELDFYLSKNVYLLGYTAWATTGKCGGFGIGVGGIGYDFDISNDISWQSKIAAGTGGGKYIDKSGLILLFNTGPRYTLFKGLDLDLKIGYLKFIYGTYSVPTVSLGLSYTYSIFSL